MTTAPTPSPIADAQAQVDTAWSAHGTIRAPLHAALTGIVGSLEGATGLQPGPGAERLISTFLDFAEAHGPELVTAAENKTKALIAEQARDEAIAAQPPAEVPAEPPMLTTADPIAVRSWLKYANDRAVTDALNAVLDRDSQLGWASRLLGWARADGTTAQVLASINAVISPKNPLPVVESHPAPASATDIPKGSQQAAQVVPDTLDAIVTWIGNDVVRARAAYDAELSKAQPRNEVLAKLSDILDADTPGPVNPPA